MEAVGKTFMLAVIYFSGYLIHSHSVSLKLIIVVQFSQTLKSCDNSVDMCTCL